VRKFLDYHGNFLIFILGKGPGITFHSIVSMNKKLTERKKPPLAVKRSRSAI